MSSSAFKIRGAPFNSVVARQPLDLCGGKIGIDAENETEAQAS